MPMVLTVEDVALLASGHIGIFAVGWCAGKLLLTFKQFMDAAT